jgi:hypothetical protein
MSTTYDAVVNRLIDRIEQTDPHDRDSLRDLARVLSQCADDLRHLAIELNRRDEVGAPLVEKCSHVDLDYLEGASPIVRSLVEGRRSWSTVGQSGTIARAESWLRGHGFDVARRYTGRRVTGVIRCLECAGVGPWALDAPHGRGPDGRPYSLDKGQIWDADGYLVGSADEQG